MRTLIEKARQLCGWCQTEQVRHPRLSRCLRVVTKTLLAILVLLLLFLVLDRLFPLPKQQLARDFSAMIVAEDGTPLRAFADERGVWRYPVTAEQVAPIFFTTLLNYEDRYFYKHPGINPFAMLRAVWQRLAYGRVVSGGSTLTMQVARLVDPHKRSGSGKLKQMFRALQLEWHWSKKEILRYYLNHAPYGGTFEGVEAASRSYLGKSARQLSHAEAALLTVLPQTPSRLRPDVKPQAAERARNKVIDRMVSLKLWSKNEAQQAKLERVSAMRFQQPMLAPLFSQRLKSQAQEKGLLVTTLDAGLQWSVEQRVKETLSRLPPKSSVAILVVENKNLKTRAYVGSADLNDEKRFGHIDMVSAQRSPGSTLKPFLYGMAIEEGLVHSASLLSDAPVEYAGYQPGNFVGEYSGPVSLTHALQQSLNITAVQVLHHFDPVKFSARLRNGGLILTSPHNDRPNLTLILGGVGTSLQSLVAGYTAFGRGGISGKLRFTPEDELVEYRMMDAGAAWIIRDILAQHSRPGVAEQYLNWSANRQVAWKTGTSYGFRDAWAIGVTDTYTIGVWVGRPDGTPVPGHYGVVTAAPILFELVDTMPKRDLGSNRIARPANVQQVKICWPTGVAYRPEQSHLCQQEHNAWVLNQMIPPTLSDVHRRDWIGHVVHYKVNTKTGRLVDASCPVEQTAERSVARWPDVLEPWLSMEARLKSRLPKADKLCTNAPYHSGGNLKIKGLANHTVLHRAGPKAPTPLVELAALGGQGKLYWIINGKLARTANVWQTVHHNFSESGNYTITVTDLKGQYDSIEIRVIN